MDKLFGINELEVFHKIAKVVVENLYFEKSTLCVEIPVSILEQAKAELKGILISNEFNIEKIRKVFTDKSQEKSRVDLFVALIGDRSNELIYESILDHNSSAGDVLMDFDWSLKLIFGTSDLKSLNYQVLQLALNTVTSKKASGTVYELTKDILLNLIHLLEGVDSS